MEIDANHRLTSPSLWTPLPGGSNLQDPPFLIMHFTSGWTAEGTLEFWKAPEAKGACAHIIIDRDGSIRQCRPFNRTAGHAGKSRWRGRNGKLYEQLNAYSIGIELCNTGDMGRTVFPSSLPLPWKGQPIPLQKAKHKNGGPLTTWEVFPGIQIAAAVVVARLLRERYGIKDCLGHDDIAPDRKNDPGPLFDMADFRLNTGFPSVAS